MYFCKMRIIYDSCHQAYWDVMKNVARSNRQIVKLIKKAKKKLLISITRPLKYIDNFTTKNWKFSDTNSDIFHNPAQNIDCGYSLEPLRRGGSITSIQNLCFLSRNKTRNVSIWHRCPRLGAILTRRKAFCKKWSWKEEHNSHNNWRILP